MKIFPAIDIIGGAAVRLTKGDYGTAKKYSDDPVAVAMEFAESGAKCLHLVDLDGAKSGVTENYETVKSIVARTSAFVEIGGGIRDEARIEKYLETGVQRVILGTAAIRDPEFRRRAVKKYGGAVAIGVDVKDGYAATDGWQSLSRYTGVELVKSLRDEGVQTVIYTDISRDGMLMGTNLDAYAALSEIEGISVVASGGVTTSDEVRALRDMRIYGAILGKALYEKRISLAEALAVARGEK